jgi:thioredoxin reductase (NADPH)
MDNKVIDCVIVGSGPAGYTAAIYAARAGMNPVLYTGDTPGGQLTTTTDVENFPGYPSGVTGPEMMMDLQKQAERFGTKVHYNMVDVANLSGDTKTLILDNGQTVLAKTVLVSTGATAKWLGLPGEVTYNGKGVSACAVCDGFFYRGQEVVVVGGGDTACEEASYLAKLCTKVYLVVRKDELRASLIMQKRVQNTHNIEILWNSETVDLQGEDGLELVKIKNRTSGEILDLKVGGFFVAIGHKPNTDIFRGQLDMDEAGYIITKAGSTQTNIEGVFACGDAQDNVYRQAITAAGTGCMAALDAERYIASKETVA